MSVWMLEGYQNSSLPPDQLWVIRWWFHNLFDGLIFFLHFALHHFCRCLSNHSNLKQRVMIPRSKSAEGYQKDMNANYNYQIMLYLPLMRIELTDKSTKVNNISSSFAFRNRFITCNSGYTTPFPVLKTIELNVKSGNQISWKAP
jgi:hypothetical protein